MVHREETSGHLLFLPTQYLFLFPVFLLKLIVLPFSVCAVLQGVTLLFMGT